jgi:TRAP-type C4-dicarboxylate transport system permease small subunit
MDTPSETPEPSADGEPDRPARWSAVIRLLDAVRRVADRVLAVICIVAFVALVAIVVWQVFTRQVLQDSAPWTEEAARYAFVVLALLGAALVFSERGHIAVEIVVTRLPEAAQLVVAVIVELLVAFFAVYVFIFGGIRVVQNAWAQDISTLPVSVGQVYLVLPLAGILITFFSLLHLLKVVAGAETPFPPVDDTAEAV